MVNQPWRIRVDPAVAPCSTTTRTDSRMKFIVIDPIECDIAFQPTGHIDEQARVPVDKVIIERRISHEGDPRDAGVATPRRGSDLQGRGGAGVKLDRPGARISMAGIHRVGPSTTNSKAFAQ